MKCCNKCGLKIEDNSKFCSNCGTSVNADNCNKKISDDKLIFTYRFSKVDLTNLLQAYRNLPEKQMIKKAARDLRNECGLHLGIAKQVIKKAFYQNTVMEINEHMIKQHKRKKILLVCAVVVGIMFFIGLVGNTDSDKKDSKTANTSASVSETDEKGNAQSNDSIADKIEDVDYKDFYNSYSDDKQGKWIRISGKVSYISTKKDSITIKEGLSGLDNIHIELKEKRQDVNEGDYVTIVGKVDSKILAYMYLKESYVEAVGEEAKLKVENYSQEEANKQKNLEEEYKSSCKTMKYADLARNPDQYKGSALKFTGKIIQVSEPTFGNTVNLRIDVTKKEYGFYTDTIYATVSLPKEADRLLEDDVVTIYGDCEGMYSYTSVLGAKISLPKINIRYYNLQK